MEEKLQYIQAEVLLLILAAISVFTSDNAYLCLLFAGMLMITFTIRSLSEEPDRLLLVVQMLLSVVFVLWAGGRIAFLIFYECRRKKRKWLQILFPAIAYGIAQMITGSDSLPQIILHGLILIAVSGTIFLVEFLVAGYFSAKDQISHAVSVTAVNEMYEKKLNRELTIKNYLADKNARLEERENISRNIHNSVGHSITAAIMTLDAADMLFDTAPDKAREKMNTANQRIRTSLHSIRHAVRVLDNENEFISIGDFITELNAMIDEFVMDTAMEVRSDFANVSNRLRLPHEHTEFLTGAVQELLTNGVRHGKANRFLVGLTADSGHIKLTVSDNGKSDFAEDNRQERIQKGFGLKKMVSYAERCGGTAMFGNENGFKSEITLPLIEEDEDE